MENGEAVTTLVVVAGDAAENTEALLTDWAREPAAHGAPWHLALAGATPDHAELARTCCERMGAGGPDSIVEVADADVGRAVENLLPHVSTAWCVIWAGYGQPLPGWSASLATSIAHADDRVRLVQPLVLQDDGTIAGAGSDLTSGSLVPRLRGWPVGTAVAAGGQLVDVPLSPVVAARTADLRAVAPWAAEQDGGLGEAALAAALGVLGTRSCLVAVDSRVIGHAQRRYGFRGSRRASDRAARENAVRIERLPAPGAESPDPYTERTTGGLSLRWTIGTSAPSGLRGHRWGDTAFAEALASSLRDLGHEVAVDTLEARTRPTQSLTDVAVTLRGLHRQQLVAGAVNVLWVISHPERVTRDEAAEHDIVYAASVSWARDRSADWGLDIRPLLQCTDPEVFTPTRQVSAPRSGVCFVGTTLDRPRPLVDRALAEGVDVMLVGRGWRDRAPATQVLDEYASSQRVAELYASSQVVLCDHWEDMRRDGFVANRVFDALAAGATVVCDDVAGVTELVPGGVVQVARGEVSTALRRARASDDRARAAAVEVVATQHSFLARARRLEVDALSALADQRLRRRAPRGA